MTIEACSPLQVDKDSPCWPLLKREAGEPMRMTRGVGCHRFVLDKDNRSVYEYRHFEERSHNDSIDWPWVDSKSQFVGKGKHF